MYWNFSTHLQTSDTLSMRVSLRGGYSARVVRNSSASHVEAFGSLLFSRDGAHEHGGLSVQVADTVGAGDAFTAALVHHYLRRASLETMNQAANLMGAWVASNEGATPEPDRTILEKVRNAET